MQRSMAHQRSLLRHIFSPPHRQSTSLFSIPTPKTVNSSHLPSSISPATRCFSTTTNSTSASRSLSTAAAAASSSAPKRYVEISTLRPSYLDNQATTAVDPRVLDSMLPFLAGRYGNPHSRSHAYGWDTDQAVEIARDKIAKCIGARVGKKEIIFTSGATESNNLAIKGVANYHDRLHGASLSGDEKKPRLKSHIITTEIEHKCVLASCRELSTPDGGNWEITYLPVDKYGLVDLEQLKAEIRPETAIVSIMHVNNEIGSIQDIKEIGQICRDKTKEWKKQGLPNGPVLFHTDAAQAVAKVPVNVQEMNVDILSISGHKFYGPKGIGCLYVRKKDPRVRLRPILDGGGQEFGLRSGTLPPHLCVGLGAALELAIEEMPRDQQHIRYLATYFEKEITKRLPAVDLNGPVTQPRGEKQQRYIGNVNLSFSCVEGESLLMALSRTMSVSSGSACTSASLEPSYVLRALQKTEEDAHTSIRFGIGRFTTKSEVDEAIERIVESVEKLRDMSPLWDMYLEQQEAGEEEGGQVEAKTAGVKWG